VVDLVVWSFVIALAPVVVGLAWNLISGTADRIGRTLARALADAEPWRLHGPVSFSQTPACVSAAGRTLCAGSARSRATIRRGPSQVGPSARIGPRNDA
jgi:hypothetical protein